MYIYCQKTGKYEYVVLKQSIYIGGKTVTKIIKKFGRRDRLEAEDPDAVSKLKAMYDGKELKSEAEAELMMKDALEHISKKDELLRKSSEPVGMNLLNYGMYPLLTVWDDDLKLTEHINYLIRQYTKIKFDAARYLTYLCLRKVIDPSSVYAAFGTCGNYLGDWLHDCKLDELYRSYEFLAEYKDAIMKHVNQRLDKLIRNDKQPTMIFYDVTNVYFETELTDDERCRVRPHSLAAIIDILHEAVQAKQISFDTARPYLEEISDILKECPDIDEAMEDRFCADMQKLIQLLPEKDYAQRLKEALFLRTRGKCKSHRFDLPLVSIALVIDEYGFPIDFQVFPGCSSEFRTMEPAIKSMREKYHIKETIVSADRGLNSADNLQMLLKSNLGFLVAQKVTDLEKRYQEQLLNPEGYSEFYSDSGELVWKYKAIDNYQRKDKTGSTLECTIIFTYSKARYDRDIAILERDLERAQRAVSTHAEIAKNQRAWNSLVVSSGKKTAQRLNSDAIEKRRSLCGYAAILYHASPDSQKQLTSKEVATSYRKLEKIEESFRLMKSNFDLRPVYVSMEERIKGHCTLCVLALLIQRMLETRLERQNIHLTPDEIQTALKGAYVFPVRNGSEISYIHTPKEGQLKIDAHDKAVGYADLKKFIQDRKDSHIGSIMKACDLTPLSCASSRTTLCHNLGRRYATDEEVIGLYYR